MFYRFYIILFYIIICVSSVFSINVTSGLTFRSHNVIKEKRTSLLLNEGENFTLPNGFSLQFDVRFLSEEHNYGYICRIIGNDSICFDLISNYRKENKVLSFLEGNRIFLPFKSINNVSDKDWNKMNIHLDLKSQKTTISFNDETIETSCNYIDMTKFRFQFGFCNYEKFISYDVPPVTIRNIRLIDSKNNLVAYWPLEKHNINEVYDSISHRIAKVYNPIWEIDKHTEWIKERHLRTSLYTQVAYNENDNLIYFANNEYLFIYNPSENNLDSVKPVSGYPFHVSSNQLMYNKYTKQLTSYDPEYMRTSVYNFENNSWSGQEPTLRPPYTHHNSFVSSKDSLIYIFGGYGEYLYKNDIIGIDPVSHKEILIDYDKSITPRYLSAVGFKDAQTLLLMGGYGNESGKQELGPHNYYDFYEIDINTFKIKKLWNLDLPNEHFLFSNNMVVDTIRNKVYALTFPNDRSNTYIQLRSFNMEDGKNEILGDTIPYTFEDINSFCTLFLDSKTNKLFAVTIYNNQEHSDIFVYSLLYPPLSKSEVRQEEPQKSIPITLIASIIIFIFLIIFGLFVYNLTKKKKVNTTVNIYGSRNEDEYIFKYPIKKSSILFLNGFQVWDKGGNDITKDFTPTLRYLLILIMLYTQKNGKGVSNTTLKETLWNDKSEDKAQNNRRVNIQKLKKLLDKLDGIELINTNTYWTLKYEDTFFSDYFMVYRLMNEIESEEVIEYDKLNDLLHLLSYGIPLPYLHQHWADSFISDYSLLVQEYLWSLVDKEPVKNDNKLQISIADIIFIFDPTDEDTLALKCSALHKLGKTGQAKMTYDWFCTEYKRIIGIDFDKDFNYFIDKQ